MSSSGLVPLSDFLGRQRRAYLERQASVYLWAAAIVGVAFLLSTVTWLTDQLRGDGMSLVEWLLALPGSILCGGLICLIAWGQYRSLRRKVTNRILLSGTRLIAEDIYGRREVDLAASLCQVKLTGGTKSNYLPVLLVRRDENDIWPFVVDLCEPDTAALRSPQDMLLLAAALEQTSRRESWDAAGRLRTLASWSTLPTIYGADPDAIPITAAGPVPGRVVPTPVRSAEPSPEVTLPPRKPTRPARRIAVDLLLVVLVLVLIGASLTVGTYTGDVFEEKLRTGVAQATECTRYGPVSRSGFGYWYQCHAEVTWSDGVRQSVTTRGSKLTPDEIGKDVRVRELRQSRSRTDVYRLDDPPQFWGLVVSLLLFFVALLCALRPVVDVFRVGRWLIGRHRAARA